MKNEHIKLVKDLFHAISIAAFGVFLFAPDVELASRMIALDVGAYAHAVADRP